MWGERRGLLRLGEGGEIWGEGVWERAGLEGSTEISSLDWTKGTVSRAGFGDWTWLVLFSRKGRRAEGMTRLVKFIPHGRRIRQGQNSAVGRASVADSQERVCGRPYRIVRSTFFFLLPLLHYRPNPVVWLCPQTATKPLSRVVAATWVSLPSRADGDRRRAWTSCKVALRRGDRATMAGCPPSAGRRDSTGLACRAARKGKGDGNDGVAWRGETTKRKICQGRAGKSHDGDDILAFFVRGRPAAAPVALRVEGALMCRVEDAADKRKTHCR